MFRPKPQNLEKAVFFGQSSNVSSYLTKGLDPNLKNSETGDTLLHVASAMGHSRIVGVLLRAGAHPNSRNHRRETPLHYAAMNNRVEVIHMLRRAGVNLRAEDVRGRTAQNVADNVSIAGLLGDDVSLQRVVNPFDENGDTLVHRYASVGRSNKIKKIAHKGANLNWKNKNGNTPLHISAGNDHYKVCVTLIDRMVDINIQNEQGETPLIIATKHGHDSIVELLMDRGCDASLIDAEGKSASEYAFTPAICALFEVPVPNLPEESQPIRKTSKTIGCYELGKTLGVGGFGKVKEAVYLPNEAVYAIKIIPRENVRTESQKTRLFREIAIMKLLSHVNVCGMTEAFETRKNIYLVMEKVTGIELFDFIISQDCLDEPLAQEIFRQIVDGIHYCHSLNVVHRDLKPENIMITGAIKNADGEQEEVDLAFHKQYIQDQKSSKNITTYTVKIIDFGLSNVNEREIYATACGSPHYAAPELLLGRAYTTSLDVWSLGIVLYAMLFGHLPFQEDDEHGIQHAIITLDKKLWFPEKAVSNDAKNLLRRMLSCNPARRISIEEVRFHPWVNLGRTKNQFPPIPEGEPRPDILEKMSKLGFTPDNVKVEIAGQRNTVATRVYSLINDHTKAEEERRKLEKDLVQKRKKEEEEEDRILKLRLNAGRSRKHSKATVRSRSNASNASNSNISNNGSSDEGAGGASVTSGTSKTSPRTRKSTHSM